MAGMRPDRGESADAGAPDQPMTRRARRHNAAESEPLTRAERMRRERMAMTESSGDLGATESSWPAQGTSYDSGISGYGSSSPSYGSSSSSPYSSGSLPTSGSPYGTSTSDPTSAAYPSGSNPSSPYSSPTPSTPYTPSSYTSPATTYPSSGSTGSTTDTGSTTGTGSSSYTSGSTYGAGSADKSSGTGLSSSPSSPYSSPTPSTPYTPSSYNSPATTYPSSGSTGSTTDTGSTTGTGSSGSSSYSSGSLPTSGSPYGASTPSTTPSAYTPSSPYTSPSYSSGSSSSGIGTSPYSTGSSSPSTPATTSSPSSPLPGVGGAGSSSPYSSGPLPTSGSPYGASTPSTTPSAYTPSSPYTSPSYSSGSSSSGIGTSPYSTGSSSPSTPATTSSPSSPLPGVGGAGSSSPYGGYSPTPSRSTAGTLPGVAGTPSASTPPGGFTATPTTGGLHSQALDPGPAVPYNLPTNTMPKLRRTSTNALPTIDVSRPAELPVISAPRTTGLPVITVPGAPPLPVIGAQPTVEMPVVSLPAFDKAHGDLDARSSMNAPVEGRSGRRRTDDDADEPLRGRSERSRSRRRSALDLDVENDEPVGRRSSRDRDASRDLEEFDEADEVDTTRDGRIAPWHLGLAALFLVLPWIMHDALSPAEQQSLKAAQLPGFPIRKISITTDGILGTYHLLLHPLVSMVPPMIGARALSVLGFAVTVSLACRIGRLVDGARGLVVAGVVTMMNPLLIGAAVQVKPYTLATAVATAAVLRVLHIALDRKPVSQLWWVTWLGALAGYLHFFAFLAPVAAGMGMVVRRRSIRRLRHSSGMWPALTAFCLMMPVGLIALVQIQQTSDSAPFSPISAVEMLAAALVRAPGLNSPLGHGIVLLVLSAFGLGCLVMMAWSARRLRRPEESAVLTIAVSWLVLPSLGIVAASVLVPMLVPGYVTASVPAVGLLAALSYRSARTTGIGTGRTVVLAYLIVMTVVSLASLVIW
ncbi:hypothetical protein KEM60_01528 [Austwickia sp. TVS 96-490-7B]|uniref:hypothetical protein n=1 Tax=Austwickia sp. TVS 96-490-7B TaxID=2830843 RepID=UPI001C5A08AB|nr:hypothetical protein [Austwickia sp. TVS 96-490-7B]MBW3085331.1 hypothetical protein [Austwickia sp. TVS 96-490-7B]